MTPYLIVSGAATALDYYKMAFDAQELMRMPGPNGKIAHAEIQIGNSRVMLADESPQMGHKSPQTLGGSGTGLMLYVNDVDDTFQRAVSAGGKVAQPVKDQFYGDRSGNRRTRSVTSGRSPHTSKTSRRRKSNAAWTRR